MRPLAVAICLTAASVVLSAPTLPLVRFYPMKSQRGEPDEISHQVHSKLQSLQSMLEHDKDSAQGQPAPVIFAPILVLATGQGSQSLKLGGVDPLQQLPFYPQISSPLQPGESDPKHLPAEWIPHPIEADPEPFLQHSKISLAPEV
ncbi:hypothetical protein ANCCAN_00095 [Ancylostoma caninum]|uniref:Uncharacterized protein n=1 Tax=Ancylostoma caninum TaxID=29170 RepID=A0A368HAG6_ANCCA|nr:hypothetical protein ANCCAN_00095 [Ancylostoma caninum]